MLCIKPDPKTCFSENFHQKQYSRSTFWSPQLANAAATTTDDEMATASIFSTLGEPATPSKHKLGALEPNRRSILARRIYHNQNVIIFVNSWKIHEIYSQHSVDFVYKNYYMIILIFSNLQTKLAYMCASSESKNVFWKPF